MEQPKKYIKVEHKDLETGKEYIQMHPVMIKNRKDERKEFPELQWVQEVPDRESELIEMLERIIRNFEGDYVLDGEIVDQPYNWLIDRYKEAKKLIESVKQPK